MSRAMAGPRLRGVLVTVECGLSVRIEDPTGNLMFLPGKPKPVGAVDMVLQEG